MSPDSISGGTDASGTHSARVISLTAFGSPTRSRFGPTKIMCSASTPHRMEGDQMFDPARAITGRLLQFPPRSVGRLFVLIDQAPRRSPSPICLARADVATSTARDLDRLPGPASLTDAAGPRDASNARHPAVQRQSARAVPTDSHKWTAHQKSAIVSVHAVRQSRSRH